MILCPGLYAGIKREEDFNEKGEISHELVEFTRLFKGTNKNSHNQAKILGKRCSESPCSDNLENNVTAAIVNSP